MTAYERYFKVGQDLGCSADQMRHIYFAPLSLQITNENKNTLDCGWFLLREMLEYKAIMAGKKTVAVNPKNTSKMCSTCGNVNEGLKLSDRVWTCECCGMKHDRDLNASYNILRLGHESLEAASNLAAT